MKTLLESQPLCVYFVARFAFSSPLKSVVVTTLILTCRFRPGKLISKQKVSLFSNRRVLFRELMSAKVQGELFGHLLPSFVCQVYADEKERSAPPTVTSDSSENTD